MARLLRVREELNRNGFPDLALSTGDTPSCSVCDDLSDSTEIRPGNFVFYDVQQLLIGSCQADQISAALACPVVAKHPERHELVIHGGAVHLSKDNFIEGGLTKFGLVAFPTISGWSKPVEGAYVARLSQEHGILHFENGIEKINIGDILCILPAHVCLTVVLMRNFLTLDGKIIHTMNS
jgi:D-serine deaminase-like pyridoxal phosphate-dependent protein